MPNWCSTNIVITGNQKQIDHLYGLLEKWTEKSAVENDFGSKWLGNIVVNSGIGTVDEDKPTDLECRGFITGLEKDKNSLIIDTETAWVPMLDMWYLIMDKYLEDGNLEYVAEEGGCEIFETNKDELTNCYNVSVFEEVDGFFDEDEDLTANQLRERLQKLLNSDAKNIDKLIEELNDSDYGECFSIHQWENPINPTHISGKETTITPDFTRTEDFGETKENNVKNNDQEIG